MPKRSSKPRDLDRLAAAVDHSTDGDDDEEQTNENEGKDPAAVELGRKGGRKGGKARAERMTAEERSEAARKAAEARWSRDS